VETFFSDAITNMISSGIAFLAAPFEVSFDVSNEIIEVPFDVF